MPNLGCSKDRLFFYVVDEPNHYESGYYRKCQELQ